MGQFWHTELSNLFILNLVNFFVCDSSLVSQQTAIKPQETLYIVKQGGLVIQPCEIENRRDATVIWQFSKTRIPETLTIGTLYYRRDLRIRVIANETLQTEQSWHLEIRKVKLEDEGYYMCKVSAKPESLKRVVYLRVQVEMTIDPVDPIISK